MNDNLNDFINLIKEKNLKLSSVESITGGKFSSLITSISGASDFFKISFITYSDEAKIIFLNIDENILKEKGAISEEVAIQMLKKAKEIFPVDFIISFTGNAGPKAAEKKEVGMSFIGINFKDNYYSFKFFAKSNERNEIILETINFALLKAIEILKK